ncbi:shikimate dehydrogenase [Dactylosporangium sp. NPDC005572]|uniref:shikimate dehydrogenase n=1 Tax=Dactylosporangium sp. NPDC005572 TaxID=3156889 RepID=UPI0033A2C4F6
MPTERRAAVLGKPVSHSRSPVLHNAGYRAAGLTHWRYTAVECGEAELRGLVEGLGQEWAGLSLTMPLKEEALRVAALVDPFAQAIGAANTLVRRAYGWHAYNTDAPGMVRALLEAGVSRTPRLALLGGGGTARAAIAAAAALGADVTVYTRRPEAADELRPVADALNVDLAGEPWERAAEAATAPVVISTVPKGAADHLATADWSGRPVVFDAIYDPWPTPLAAAAQHAGCAIVSGLDLLLWQAADQFELFTGVAAPVGEMRSALYAAG